MRPLFLALALLGAALPGPAVPLHAQADPGIDIPHTRFILDHGLTLIVHEDRKAPIVAVNVWYHVGSKNERPGKTGFAHLFELRGPGYGPVFEIDADDNVIGRLAS